MMLQYKTIRYAVAAVVLASICLPACALADQVVIKDTFTLDGSKRKAGQSLDGLQVETGSGTWVAPNAFLGPAGFIHNGQTKKVVQAQIALHDVNGLVVCKSSVNVRDSGWCSIGLLSKDSGANWFSPENQLWFYLTQKGQWQLVRSGSGTQKRFVVIKVGQFKEFDASVNHVLAITYDPSANTVAAAIDDRTVVLPVDLKLFTPDIKAAGFRIQLDEFTGEHALIDDFEVRTDPNPSR